jgi:hypothetical protein
MARISAYDIDSAINPDDKVLGTDSLGFVTKNYTFQGIVNWINRTGSVVILGQNNYFFQTIAGIYGRGQGTISFTSFGGADTPFSSLTTFKISESSLAGYTIENYLGTIVGKNVLLAQLDNVDNFGVYTVTGLVRDVTETEFYNITFDYVEGNGTLLVNKFYGLSVYPALSTDKNYVHTQAVPSAIWNITHDLNKLPSVTVVNINNVTVYGEVTYVDLNNLRIEFSAGFSGKAYIN